MSSRINLIFHITLIFTIAFIIAGLLFCKPVKASPVYTVSKIQILEIDYKQETAKAIDLNTEKTYLLNIGYDALNIYNDIHINDIFEVYKESGIILKARLYKSGDYIVQWQEQMFNWSIRQLYQ